MTKATAVRTGDYIEWRKTRQIEVETVRTLPTGDVEIMGRGIDFNGYAQGTYSPDADILVIAREPLEE